MKIFLTGASGLVGGAFASLAAQAGHTVIGVVGSFSAPLPGLAEKLTLDLADESALVQALRRARPEAIVNAAAISEPAKCDENPVRAQRLNVDLPAALARHARDHGARLLHLSSEQVFAGDRAPYAVTDPVAPLNLYARQKVESERVVAALAPGHAATVRAPLLMGNSPGGRRSLHERLFGDWSAGRAPRLYTDEFRQTCTAENLAAALLELCARPELCGVFHWAGAEVLSRHEQGLRVRAHFRLSPERAPIVTVERAATPAISATRPANLALDLQPLSRLLRTPVETFAQQLAALTLPAPCRAWYEAAPEVPST
jgi:dTDP-4-dehydrorhamnose reductase